MRAPPGKPQPWPGPPDFSRFWPPGVMQGSEMLQEPSSPDLQNGSTCVRKTSLPPHQHLRPPVASGSRWPNQGRRREGERGGGGDTVGAGPRASALWACQVIMHLELILIKAPGKGLDATTRLLHMREISGPQTVSIPHSSSLSNLLLLLILTGFSQAGGTGKHGGKRAGRGGALQFGADLGKDRNG